MALQDLSLDFENKTINNEFIKGKELILQEVILALQCWTGDWFLDNSYGTPYDLRLNNKSLLLADIQDIILSVPGVVSTQNIDIKIEYDTLYNKQKVFHIYAEVITQDNEQVILNGLIPIVGV